MPIKVVLFDLGNVIIPISLEKTLSCWKQKSRINESELLKILESDDPLYYGFERGEITPEEFRKEISARIGFSFSDEEFNSCWNRMLDGLTKGVPELLKSLKKHYRLALLSNTNQIHADCFLKKHPEIFECFEKLFLSHEIHSRKPELVCFQTVLDSLRVKPDEMVFLDDREEFVRAAEKFGIHGIVVKKPEDIREGLKKLGVLF